MYLLVKILKFSSLHMTFSQNSTSHTYTYFSQKYWGKDLGHTRLHILGAFPETSPVSVFRNHTPHGTWVAICSFRDLTRFGFTQDNFLNPLSLSAALNSVVFIFLAYTGSLGLFSLTARSFILCYCKNWVRVILFLQLVMIFLDFLSLCHPIYLLFFVLAPGIQKLNQWTTKLSAKALRLKPNKPDLPLPRTLWSVKTIILPVMNFPNYNGKHFWS